MLMSEEIALYQVLLGITTNQPTNQEKEAFLVVVLEKFPVYVVESYVKQLEKMQNKNKNKPKTKQKRKTKKTQQTETVKNAHLGYRLQRKARQTSVVRIAFKGFLE